MTGIKNDKSQIIGTDNHSAGISGSATMAEDSAQASQGAAGTTGTGANCKFVSGVNGTIRVTFTDIVTPADSVLILVVAQATGISNNNSKNWIWQKDDVDYLSGFTLLNAMDFGSTEVNIKVLVDASPAAGTHTYKLKENNANNFGGVEATITFIKLTDTHAGVLNGANTQDTLEDKIIA